MMQEPVWSYRRSCSVEEWTMDPVRERETLPPVMRGNQLVKRPVLSSIIVAILAGVMLTMSNIVGFRS